MNDQELMQQALGALEWNLPVIEDYGNKEQSQRQHKAITALRDRLAQPEQELMIDCPRCGHCCPRQQWPGLTDEDRQELAAEQHSWEGLCFAVEAKLKEKNT